MCLTQERLEELLSYNPWTGKFYWKYTHTSRAVKGTEAGYLEPSRYIRIRIDGKNYSAHRLVWLYMHGYFPEGDLDHINKVRFDNRLINLREVSKQCNQRNSRRQTNNKSGITGVHWEVSRNKWRSYIYVNNKRKRLGSFKDFDEAVCARLAAEQCLDWLTCNRKSDAEQYVQNVCSASMVKILPKVVK